MRNKRDDVRNLLIERPVDPLASDAHDPMGSYTGRPTEKWELPVQDADDL